VSSLDDIRNIRLEKLKKLKRAGINPYPIFTKQDRTLKEAEKNFSKLSKSKKPIYLVGRVTSLRPQGGLIFFHIFDGTGKFQGLLKKAEKISREEFELFHETIDIGDFIEVRGNLFVTKRKEKTLLVHSWRILAKSLRPLPEKWHGLQDVEERFRRRYLDTLMSEEVRERFLLRAKLVTEIRKVLDTAGYVEVETPALQPLYGGASAEPFITHHRALDIDLYLRISDELYLKRLLVGGFPKIYEIARDFRNEGIDHTHNPEFTMLEFYESFSDAKKQMAFVEKMMKAVVKKLLGKTEITHKGSVIDFGKKFTVVAFYDLLRQWAHITEPESMSRDEAALRAKQFGIDVEPEDSLVKILDGIYKKTCRPKLIQPTFVIDYPVDYLPLTKRKEDNEKLVDAFQLFAGGIELAKAFSELNDPLDQRERFKKQEEVKERGDRETQPLDEDFIEAMEYGMPPAGGVGIGIDRLTMLLTDSDNIKEVILFPTLRPKKE
jgi:lysyl-tRNA synthetase class 2